MRLAQLLNKCWGLSYDVRVWNKAVSCWKAFSPTQEKSTLQLSKAAWSSVYNIPAESQAEVMSSPLRLWTSWLNRESREKPSEAPPTGSAHNTATSSSSSPSSSMDIGWSWCHTSRTTQSDWVFLSAAVSIPILPHLAQQHTLGTGAFSRLPMVTAGQFCWRYSAALGVTERPNTKGRGALVKSSTLSLNKCTFSRNTSGESSSSTDVPKDTRSSCSSWKKPDYCHFYHNQVDFSLCTLTEPDGCITRP